MSVKGVKAVFTGALQELSDAVSTDELSEHRIKSTKAYSISTPTNVIV